MSSPAIVEIPTAAPALSAAAPPSLDYASAAKAGRRRKPWALADQVLVSGANFVTMVMTARALHPDQFGTFTQAYAILLLANLFQSALVVQAHNVHGDPKDGARYATFTTTTAVSQLGLCAIQAIVIALVASVAQSRGVPWAALAWSLVPAVCAWQAQEFVRRVLYTEGRHAAALVNDCVSYGGQGLAILLLWQQHALNDTRAMYVLAWTSLAAALLGCWQIRKSLSGSVDGEVLRENWRFGRWLLGGEILAYVASIQTYLFIAAYLLGASAAGELRAAQIVYGPTRVFSFYLGNVLPIRFSRALSEEGEGSARRQFREVLRQVAPPFALYAGVVAAFAGPILRLLYGSDFAGRPLVLQVYSAVAVLSYIQVIFVSLLTAQRRTRAIFVGQLAGAALGLAVGWVAILMIGIAGAPLAIGISTLATMIYLNAQVRGAEPRGFEVAASSDAAVATATPDAAAAVAVLSGKPLDEAADLRTRRAKLLVDALAGLDAAGIRYCVAHGHAALPDGVDGDVDCVIDRGVARGAIAAALAADGRRIVQWLSDGADYIVVADADRRLPAMVALHLTTVYELYGYRVFAGHELLNRRERRGGLWVTPPALEAACVVANRLLKRNVRAKDRARLGELFAADRAGATQAVGMLLGDADARALGAAAASGDWAAIEDDVARLDAALRQTLAKGDRLNILGRRLADHARRLSRWVRPRNGFHVVFLGPDGVGKSTVIEHVEQAVRPAFLHYSYQTFAPSLLPMKYQKKDGPHSKPPRSVPASLMKAAWWTFCYGPLYLYVVHPVRARAGLVINHRYLLDAIVDRKRYRYSGPGWLLKGIWLISPKPDLVVLLEAPADVIQKRKQEQAPEETARQCVAYRKLIDTLHNGVRVSAAQPIDATIADANEAILSRMEARFGAGK